VSAHGTVVERDPRTGRGIRLAGVLQDLTDARMAEEALRRSEERLRLAQEAGGVGSWEWDIGSGALHWSESCYRLHGMDPALPVTFADWCGCLHPQDRPRVEASLQAALAGPGSGWEIEFRFLRPSDNEERWIIGRGQVVRDPVTRRALRVLGVGLDVTERRRAQERLVLLAREVDHRAKNALAVVQAAVRLAPKHDAAAFAMAVEGRVAALARAQVLLAETGWRGAALRVIAEGALAAFLELDGADGARAVLSGPAVQLVPAAAQPVALALHELATNAAKYGALSEPGGRLELSWRLDEPADLLRLDWVETGGPPVSGPPMRRGFGSRVIAATIAEQLGGTIEHRWDPSGLRCGFVLPMARIGAGGH
jgi:PAS domain S-box-containing protein